MLGVFSETDGGRDDLALLLFAVAIADDTALAVPAAEPPASRKFSDTTELDRFVFSEGFGGCSMLAVSNTEPLVDDIVVDDIDVNDVTLGCRNFSLIVLTRISWDARRSSSYGCTFSTSNFVS